MNTLASDIYIQIGHVIRDVKLSNVLRNLSLTRKGGKKRKKRKMENTIFLVRKSAKEKTKE